MLSNELIQLSNTWEVLQHIFTQLLPIINTHQCSTTYQQLHLQIPSPLLNLYPQSIVTYLSAKALPKPTLSIVESTSNATKWQIQLHHLTLPSIPIVFAIHFLYLFKFIDNLAYSRSLVHIFSHHLASQSQQLIFLGCL